jgi:hypothetical protein
MDAYIYQAALWCADCIKELKPSLQDDCECCGGSHPDLDLDCRAYYRPGHSEDEFNEPDEVQYDSDDYPKGPFDNGGGEADSPQHCDSCGKFLENPLTDHGLQYVREQVAEDRASGRGDGVAAVLWADFYGLRDEDLSL